MVSDFYDDLKFSQEQSAQSWWEDVYKQAFPDMVAMTDVRGKTRLQFAGVDRLITTSAGRVWRIDEKVRREDYGDILLEFISNHKTRSPGWVAKDLECDFIAYAIKPSRCCFLLPVPPLQRAWQKHSSAWLKEYGEKQAYNKGYTTLNCPVPFKELMRKISEAMYFRWSEQFDEKVNIKSSNQSGNGSTHAIA